MSEPYEPKLSDAIKDQIPPAEKKEGESPRAPDEVSGAEIRQHNREVNQGYRDRDDRLVDVGRGSQTTGRL